MSTTVGRFSHRRCRTCLWILTAFLALGASRLQAQGEAYYFATGGIEQGDNAFVDRFCGPDMLPYTADDFDLPERGNVGGTWGFSWIDTNGDGVMQEDEHIFDVIRRGDDDAHTFSTKGYPQYGVLAEAENWIDYHEARNQGPSRTEIGDVGPEGDDFEHNDRGGLGQPGFEGAVNYYWFNNAQADQRGWGGSKYYFEHRNGVHLDEIEGFNHWLTFQNNKDDPTTPELDERGNCRNSYMRSSEAVTKGLLIPVADIADLADGDLDPLFGWYSGDMAAYVRDVLGPKLSDPDLAVFTSDSGCGFSGLPATHVMLLQVECPVSINPGGECNDVATAEAQAAYWGITPINPGEPATDAVYRVCHILLFNDELTAVDQGVPNFSLDPVDGVGRNLWVQDDFWRDDESRIGRYTLDGEWVISQDTSLDHGCSETDKLFLLAGGGPGSFEAPVDAELDPAAGAVYGIVELALQEAPPPVAAGVGAGAPTDRTYQIQLLHGTEVVAYGEWAVNGDVRVAIGGTYDTTLRAAVNPTAEATGTGIGVPVIDPLNSFFPRIVLRASSARVQLLYSEEDAYVPNNYDDLDNYDNLVTLNQGITQTITSVRVAVGNASIDESTVVDGFAVLQSLKPDAAPAGLFVRGDTNNDGKADLSDAVFLLAHLFLGGPRWACEDAARINPGPSQDLSDAVFLLAHLFTGGPAPLAPFPACGVDPDGGSCAESHCNG